ncbi:MAG: NADPH2:quinone reductase [Gammaproteobacteria bacterium]|jgi:NADPH2:quinone reductase
MKKSIQIRSTVRDTGVLELSLVETEVPAPGPKEIVLRVDATPINPSDLGLLLSAAEMSAASRVERDGQSILTAPIAPERQAGLAQRMNQSLPVGNEGSGEVVAAGSSDAAQALLGKTVAVLGGAMYSQYRCVAARACLELPEGVSAKDGASCFVNPLTAIGMVETMKLENHLGLVHTAAASNLGQMLVKLCEADGVPLVNIVRSDAQADLLNGLGASHVCNSGAASFMDDLTAALAATNATVAFDAIGGGQLPSQILTAMERVASSNPAPENRYGSTTHKQVYSYGMLDTSPTILDRTYGMAWGIGGWLLTAFLARIGSEKAQALRQKVAREITTTFASHYTDEISLAEALQVDVAQRYHRKATGEKFLINPHK